jgi:hypothetical protein
MVVLNVLLMLLPYKYYPLFMVTSLNIKAEDNLTEELLVASEGTIET